MAMDEFELRERDVGVISGLRITFVTRSWGGEYGGTIDNAILAQRLLRFGAYITIVTGEVSGEPWPEEGNSCFVYPHLLLHHRGLLGLLRESVLLVRQLFRADVIIIIGEKPRILYLIVQHFRPLVFVRLDTILTCPGSLRFHQHTLKACTQPIGFSCLRTDLTEDCLNEPSLVRRIGRIILRSKDIVTIKAFRNFVANSQSCLRSHRRGGKVIYPSCPHPVRNRRPVSRDIVFVGRLVSYKGAVDALNIFARSELAERLHVLGDGPARSELEGLAKTLGIETRVEFHGWVSGDVRDAIIRKSGVTVVCGLWDEAFGKVGPESLAVGTPVVAYDVGGVSEWCRAPSGQLVPPGDIKAASIKVDELLSDGDLWREASRAGCNIAAQFTEERFAASWIRYISLLVTSFWPYVEKRGE